MTEQMEERLRAHFSDTAPPIGEGDTAEAVIALEQVRSSAVGRRRRRDVRRAALALTAAAAVIAGVVLVTGGDESGQVDTTPAASTSTAVPTTAPGSATTEVSTSVTATSVPAGLGVDRAFIAFESGVLGVWENEIWRQATPDDEPSLVGAEFDLVRLDEPITSAIGESEAACEIVPDNVRVGLPWPEAVDRLTPPSVAVSGVADPRPRPVTILDPASPAYRAVAAQVVADAGVTDDDPTIVQLVRTDVEGDGTDEVFGVVERLSDPESLFAQPGDYSIAFLRRVLSDDTVETVVLQSSIAIDQEDGTPFVEVYRASAFVDANGDGRTELALWSTYYEGDGMELYDVGAGSSLLPLAQAGCGA